MSAHSKFKGIKSYATADVETSISLRRSTASPFCSAIAEGSVDAAGSAGVPQATSAKHIARASISVSSFLNFSPLVFFFLYQAVILQPILKTNQ